MDRPNLSDRPGFFGVTPTRKYRLGVAVDVVVFTVDDGHLKVLLTLRERDPFEGRWSLPGGFVDENESADQAAERALAAKAGVSGVFLEQLYTFSAPDRDPRSRVVAVSYYALVPQAVLPSGGGSRESRWFRIGTAEDGGLWVGPPNEPLGPLAFDHDAILSTGLVRIRGKLEYVPLGFQLLPERFTLTDIQQVYEAILGHAIDKRNFRAKLLKSGLVAQLDDFRTGPHRPARLYKFTQRTF